MALQPLIHNSTARRMAKTILMAFVAILRTT